MAGLITFSEKTEQKNLDSEIEKIGRPKILFVQLEIEPSLFLVLAAKNKLLLLTQYGADLLLV